MNLGTGLWGCKKGIDGKFEYTPFSLLCCGETLVYTVKLSRKEDSERLSREGGR